MTPHERQDPFMPLPAASFLLAVLLLSGCADRESADQGETAVVEHPGEAGADQAGRDRQTAFRVRSDFSAGLNDDVGWAGGIDQEVSVEADRPFRLRFEVAAAGAGRGARQYRLEMRRNGGAWEPLRAENFPQPAKVHEFPLESDGNNAGRVWQVEAGDATTMNWTSGDGGEYLAIATDDQPLLALGNYSVHWQPVEFVADMRLGDEKGNRAGLIFDYRDALNHARVDVIAPDTVQLVRVADGQESVRAEHRAEVEAGRWFELKVVFDDRELVVEFDDEALVFSEPLPEGFSPWLGVYLPERSVADFQSFAVEGEPRSPRASIVASPVFEHGAPTTDLLPVSERPFSGGVGISFAELTPPWSADVGHGEWEFPMVVRRFSDRAALNEPGDRFDFRLVEAEAGPLAANVTASVTLDVPDGHIGGTFVETPMRLGPWQAETGALYFLMEPSETWNRLMTIKSSDHGQSWREVDGNNRPETGDLEGFASVLAGNRIHMLHQTSDDVWYHAFNTADHAEAPDTWAIRDERLASPGEPPTQVADLAVRSDGSVVAVYGGPDDIRLRTRSPDGHWGKARVIEAEGDAFLSGPALVRGRDDVVHLAYTSSDGGGWYRRFRPGAGLSAPYRFTRDLGVGSEDVGSVLPLVYLPESDSVSIIYRSGDGRLLERRVSPDGSWSEPLAVSDRRVVQNAVDSDQAGADAIANGEALHVLFIEAGTGRLFHASRGDGEWQEAELLIDDAEVQWVRGSVLALPGQGRVYGYVYDAGSDGGSGMNRFGYFALGTF